MDTPIDKVSGQSKIPTTQPAMTAKNLEIVKKSKEIIASSEADAKKETTSKADVEAQKDDLSISEPEERQVDVEA